MLTFSHNLTSVPTAGDNKCGSLNLVHLVQIVGLYLLLYAVWGKKPLYFHTMVSCLRTLVVLLVAALIMVLGPVASVAVLVSFSFVTGWDIVKVEYRSLN